MANRRLLTASQDAEAPLEAAELVDSAGAAVRNSPPPLASSQASYGEVPPKRPPAAEADKRG